MTKLIVLNLGKGDLEKGFPQVKASLSDGRTSPIWQGDSFLPPSPELASTYKRWKLLYNALIKRLNLSPRIEITQQVIAQVSEIDFQELSQQLKIKLNEWLNSQAFLQNIEKPLYKKLREEEQINIIIQTDNLLLKQIPWRLWDFCENFPKAEIALSAPQFESPPPSLKRPGKVRILTILGDSTGINITQDYRILKTLPNVELVPLTEPNRLELDEALRDTNGWDILFFAGHSRTEGETGRMAINPTENLSISELKNALITAIDGGLQLAIFNSCDGLGLTRELEELHIPQMIVMSQIVPDRVAYTFLKYFLPTFAQGESFYLAVRQARERLQALEREYPSASWLPVIVQNPSSLSPTWETLAGHPPLGHKLLTGISVSLVCTGLILTIRALGGLQGMELNAFDYLMGIRPAEPIDKRILIVTVDEADIQYQRTQKIKGEGSFSDQALVRLIKKIDPYHPRLIASDIIHDFPYESQLINSFKNSPKLIAICRVEVNDLQGVAAPPNFPVNQLGFSNVPLDFDGKIRRQILGMSPDQHCQTEQSFSLRVTLCYLAIQDNFSCPPPNDYWKFKQLEEKKIVPQAGGYELNEEEARGYQILINYRSSDFEKVALREILAGNLDKKLQYLIKERIILIGVDEDDKDQHLSPLSRGQPPLKLSGITIHAHMISQLLSHVLEERSLIGWLPQWGEFFWIQFWAIAGGTVVTISIHKNSFLIGLLMLVAVIFVIYGICYVFLLNGLWLPLIPAIIAVLVTSSVTWLSYQFILSKKGFNLKQ